MEPKSFYKFSEASSGTRGSGAAAGDAFLAQALGVSVAELEQLRGDHKRARESREKNGFVPLDPKANQRGPVR